jgi:hypothetical protein
MKFMTPKRICLSENRLNEEGAIGVFKGVNHKTKLLDIASNNIGLKGTKYLSERILLKKSYQYLISSEFLELSI